MKYPLMKNNITRSDLDRVIKFLEKKDPILTSSKNVLEFEKKWSKWLGVKYSVFVNSGSSANLISLAILKDKYPEGGEIIVPPLTWVSDITAVKMNGFTPVFADISMKTLSLDTEKILLKITSKTKAVFITHAQGFNGLSSKLIQILKKKKIYLIEDVCESHGATFNKKKLGSFGILSNFSFYYAHHLSTIEGGMICTNNRQIYQSARMFRGHGMVREINDKTKVYYEKKFKDLNSQFIFYKSGYNMRNNEINAIIGLNQLKRLDKNIKKRNINLKYFLKKIDKNKFVTDFDLNGCSNYAFNLILKNKDDKFSKKLEMTMLNNGIEFRRGSAGGGNQLRQPYLKPFVKKNLYKNYPITEHIHFYGYYIGNYPDLSKKKIDSICKIINSV